MFSVLLSHFGFERARFSLAFSRFSLTQQLWYSIASTWLGLIFHSRSPLLVCQSELLWSVSHEHRDPVCKTFKNQWKLPGRFRTCQRLLRRAGWIWSLICNRSYERHPRTLVHLRFRTEHVSSIATMLFPPWTLVWHGSLTRLLGQWNISFGGVSSDSRQLVHISLRPEASHHRWHQPSDPNRFSSSFCLSTRVRHLPQHWSSRHATSSMRCHIGARKQWHRPQFALAE